jgi:peptidoglycan-associated lipoprotein
MRTARSAVLTFTLAGAAATFTVGAGCSHQQKIAAHAPVAVRPQAAASPRTAPLQAAADAAAPPARWTAKEAQQGEIFFDFDSAVLRDDARPTLQKVAQSVRGRQDAGVLVEGNCDELGTVEYNLALGDQRARAAKEYLTRLGVPADRVSTLSYGSQRPKYQGHDDGARAKNRRDDLVVR